MWLTHERQQAPNSISHKDLPQQRKTQRSPSQQERQSRMVCTGKFSRLPSMSLTTVRRTGHFALTGELQRLLVSSLVLPENRSGSNKRCLFL